MGELMLSKRALLICCVVSSLTLLASFGARAQVLVSARVLSSNGPVEIQRRGQEGLTKIAYRANDELRPGDVIKTFKGGRLVLGLTDGSQAIIAEKTTVEITDLSQSPRTIFNLLSGKTRIKIEKMGGRPNPYRVNTPTAVIAVRGTLFDVFASEKETQVFVQEGEVSVTNHASPGAPVILSPGLGTRIRQDLPPEPPAPFRPGRDDNTFNPRRPDGSTGGPPDGDRNRAPRGNDVDDRAPGQNDKDGRPGGGPPGQNGGGHRPPDDVHPTSDQDMTAGKN